MDASMIGILGALGAGGIIVKLIEGIFAWINGKTGKETTAWAQRDAAWLEVAKERARADHEAKIRRQLEEHINILRIDLRSHGYDPRDWPDYKTQA